MPFQIQKLATPSPLPLSPPKPDARFSTLLREQLIYLLFPKESLPTFIILIFCRDTFSGVVPVRYDDLEVFRTVRELTGYLVLHLTLPRFGLLNFTFFENLEQIGGEQEL